MTSFSHSKIGTFETCNLQYKFKYIDKVEQKYAYKVEDL